MVGRGNLGLKRVKSTDQMKNKLCGGGLGVPPPDGGVSGVWGEAPEEKLLYPGVLVPFRSLLGASGT